MESVDWSLAAAPTHRPLPPPQLAAYLSRVSLSPPAAAASSGGAPAAADETLRFSVVRAHALAIPFESFDVTLRAPIAISPDAIFAKLVAARRGGYCLETSFLLLAALQALGFEVRLRAARVWMRCAAYTPREPPVARLHVVLVARVPSGAEFLCDVGFGGGGPAAPLPLRAGGAPAAAVCGDVFRLDAGDPLQGEDAFVLFGVQAGAWKRLYSFEHAGFEAPRVHAADFINVNHFVQAARGSLFQTICVASLPLPGGRVTLLGRELRRKGAEREGAPPATEVTRVGSAGEYRALASAHFGIELSDAQAAALFEWASSAEGPQAGAGEGRVIAGPQ